MTMRATWVLGAGALLAACSAEQPAAPPAEAAPARLAAGQWEVTSTVTGLNSTDKTAPAISAEVGDAATARACVGADGAPPAELFAAAGDQCRAQNPYVRNGRMNVQLDCTRSGSGKVMGEVAGSFTADSLKGTTTITSFFTGPGDYRLQQDIAGRRVGECRAAS